MATDEKRFKATPTQKRVLQKLKRGGVLTFSYKGFAWRDGVRVRWRTIQPLLDEGLVKLRPHVTQTYGRETVVRLEGAHNNGKGEQSTQHAS